MAGRTFGLALKKKIHAAIRAGTLTNLSANGIQKIVENASTAATASLRNCAKDESILLLECTSLAYLHQITIVKSRYRSLSQPEILSGIARSRQ